MSETDANRAFVEINDWPVWYEKFGKGPRPLLMIPGAIGTGRTDFLPQLEDEDALDLEKFTIIAVEAPGWGESRPPVRPYGINVYNNDAECFNGLMQHLGFEKYSIIGWSEGARVALLMAIKYSEAIQAIVLTSISAHISDNALKYILSKKTIESLGKDKLECYLRSYETKDEIQKLWTRYLRFVEYFNQYFPDDVCENKYHLIECPVLILHGEKDQTVDIRQTQLLCQKIPLGKLQTLAIGDNDYHQKYPATFKTICEGFLKTLTISTNGKTINSFQKNKASMGDLMK